MKIENLRAHLALFLVNTFYGANHVIAKGIMPNILTPNVFILLRVAGATALFWLIRLFSKTREKIDRKDFPRLVACGLFGVATNQLFFFHGLNLSSAINSGIIMTLNPIMVVVLSYFLLKEAITTYRVAGIMLGATGAILLTISSSSKSAELALGDLFLLINAASYAVFLVIAKPLMSKYRPLTVITYTFLFGLLFVMLFPFTFIDVAKTDFSLLTGVVLGKVLYVIIGVTFLAYLLTVYALSKVSPSVSSAYIYLQPVLVIFFALLFAYIGFTEDYTHTITSQKIFFMVLIFVGVYITSLKKRV
jgi:drug/metabolite transporter (DMT)-like permease|tara:strand:+ start:51285 stop:52199 length:915 start_codon:yes stop_codon:yes gene_type:complete